jgi:hypothetical protein
MGIVTIAVKPKDEDINQLTPNDIVIIPAFGTEVSTRKKLEAKGCQFVDTTCGDVMSVWKRVRQYSKDSVTSIIHGKAWHEETMATSSQARTSGRGHYLVVFTLAETDYVCDYILNGGNKQEFLEKFKGAYSEGFDPDVHLQAIGVANQTTMLRGETEEVQRRLKAAMVRRFGETEIASRLPMQVLPAPMRPTSTIVRSMAGFVRSMNFRGAALRAWAGALANRRPNAFRRWRTTLPSLRLLKGLTRSFGSISFAAPAWADEAADLPDFLVPLRSEERLAALASYYRVLFADLAARARGAGARLHVVYLSAGEWRGELKAPYERTLELVRAAAAPSEIPVYDTRAVFARCDDCFLPGDGHYSGAGHRRLARFLARNVLRAPA